MKPAPISSRSASWTWNALDLAVSVASGTPWPGTHEIDDPGPVVIFAGKGGEAAIVRRIRAICGSRDLKAENLPITVCPRAPHLSNSAHMAIFAEQVETTTPRLVLLDPLYLALGGASGADLYGMGQVLERPQLVCDTHGVSFMVVTHFNRGGKTGASRISGAGPAEWGRVLIGAEVKSRHTDPNTKATTVVTQFDVISSEVPD
ncbi:MAG TPA: AAA family ATPase [Jiangellaceae bacterium]|nr:AAA family ATPase [Jiangellaceae bacterium]